MESAEEFQQQLEEFETTLPGLLAPIRDAWNAHLVTEEERRRRVWPTIILPWFREAPVANASTTTSAGTAAPEENRTEPANRTPLIYAIVECLGLVNEDAPTNAEDAVNGNGPSILGQDSSSLVSHLPYLGSPLATLVSRILLEHLPPSQPPSQQKGSEADVARADGGDGWDVALTVRAPT